MRISELREADSHAQEGVSAVMALSDRIVVSGYSNRGIILCVDVPGNALHPGV